MTKKYRSRLGEVPPAHVPAVPPRQRRVPPTPKGQPLAQPRPLEPSGAPPRERGVAPPPHPLTPRLVPDVHGNELLDLFEFFPDLPRPWRKPARQVIRRLRRR